MHRIARVVVGLAGVLGGCEPAATAPTGIPQPDGTSLAVPAACRVETTRATPYQVTFRFRNARADTVYLYDLCRIQFSVSSCASGFKDDLAPNQSLPCSCEFAGSCPVGGPCANDPSPIAPGAVEGIIWTATREIQIHREAYECTVQKTVPAGLYRVALPLFVSPEAARNRAPLLTTATADFPLPAPGDQVDVTIGP